MGQLASPGKLPSTVLRNKVHPKCKSREGKEGNQYTVKAGLLGRAPRAVRRFPVRPGDNVVSTTRLWKRHVLSKSDLLRGRTSDHSSKLGPDS